MADEPVKLYVGSDYKEPKLFTHIELMFPFWGVTAKESMPYVRAASLKYQYSKDDFALVNYIADADYVVVPYNYDRLKAVNPARLQMIVEEAKRAGKPLLIDGSGDIEHPINVPNAVILRVSQYKYSARPNEITIPFPAEDLVEAYCDGMPQFREKREIPSVGFTGWAAFTPISRLKMELKEFPTTVTGIFDKRRGAERKGLFFRNRVLAALAGMPGIETQFTARASYSGHVATITGSVENNRRQFVENLRTSDYGLTVKGDANSSVRFYEILSMGRIPLFLDTACVLPLEDSLNYRDFSVFVDWRDADQIAQKLLEFHRSCTPEKFMDMQIKARDAYRSYLRMDSFSHQLAHELRKRGA